MRLFLLTLLAASLCVSHGHAQHADRPNIIYILADDLGYGDVNLELPGLDRFNNPNVQTPHLARLARESLVFTHHYAASPVCSPSRAGFLTGRAPTRNDINLWIRDLRDNDQVFLPGSEITIAELLKEKGYATAVFGKWHLNGADWEQRENWTGWTGSFPRQQGFDDGFVSKENPHFSRQLSVNTQKHPGDCFSLDGEPLGPLKGYTSDLISEAAMKWLDGRKGSKQPFFLYLPYDAVHIRVAAADRYEALYDTGETRRDVYYANITHLDAAIGNLLSHLEGEGLLDDTLIFFSSDNGPDVSRVMEALYFCHGTSHPLDGQKIQLYEGGIRVPGMVYWKGVIQPGVSDMPNSTIDVLPTLAELVGVDLPEDRVIDGQSILAHLLQGQDIQRERPIYWQFDHHREFSRVEGTDYRRRYMGAKDLEEGQFVPHVKIREGDYTLYGYSVHPDTELAEFRLFNVVNDPHEQRDLSREHPALLADLRRKLLDSFQSVRADQMKARAWIQARGR